MATATWGSTDLGGTIGMLHAKANLRVAYWPETVKGRGTIILVQGRGEFIEVYRETIDDLRGRGFAVIAFDFRGQGGSERRSKAGGHVARFSQYRDDIVAVVRHAGAVGLPKPFTILAHSMGGLATMLAAPHLASEVDRIVLAAPMLEVVRLPASPGLISAASTIGTLIGFGRMPVSKNGGTTPFAHNRLTSDAARYARLVKVADENPELMVGAPTVGWLRAALGAMQRFERTKGDPLPIPTLFVASGHDTVVSTPAIDRFARATPGGGLVMLPGARHQALLERDELRNLFFAAFDAFVTRAEPRLAPEKRPAPTGPATPFTIGKVAEAPPLVVEAAAEDTGEAEPGGRKAKANLRAKIRQRRLSLRRGKDAEPAFTPPPPLVVTPSSQTPPPGAPAQSEPPQSETPPDETAADNAAAAMRRLDLARDEAADEAQPAGGPRNVRRLLKRRN
ncbi:alpha/beta fold hydrolase [Acuticoccus kandeliae]|uniref:alpha/beta fold hydrolase n=1 Tax=Acuticoccus kandeliae TaxID=2073160 RepID=UPI000D3EC824|nr:alpha/beta hydrolase [Acuticoccus kandeliae]